MFSTTLMAYCWCSSSTIATPNITLERTLGAVRLGPGTLYGTIKRMVASGFIAEASERPRPEEDDSRRRYYSLTVLGRQVLGLEAERLQQLVTVARDKEVLR